MEDSSEGDCLLRMQISVRKETHRKLMEKLSKNGVKLSSSTYRDADVKERSASGQHEQGTSQVSRAAHDRFSPF